MQVPGTASLVTPSLAVSNSHAWSRTSSVDSLQHSFDIQIGTDTCVVGCAVIEAWWVLPLAQERLGCIGSCIPHVLASLIGIPLGGNRRIRQLVRDLRVASMGGTNPCRKNASVHKLVPGIVLGTAELETSFIDRMRQS